MRKRALDNGRPMVKPVSGLPGDVAFRDWLERTKYERDLTQMEMADRIGVFRQTITEWKHNPGSMSLWALRGLVREFGMNATDILRILEVEE